MTAVPPARRLVHLALLASALAVRGLAQAPPAGSAPNPADVEAGRRIYHEGLLPSGEPLRATVRGDVGLAGPQAACVACHRRSDLGTVESGTIALQVAGDVLFRPVWRGRPEMGMARTTGLNTRPAYTGEAITNLCAPCFTVVQRSLLSMRYLIAGDIMTIAGNDYLPTCEEIQKVRK